MPDIRDNYRDDDGNALYPEVAGMYHATLGIIMRYAEMGAGETMGEPYWLGRIGSMAREALHDADILNWREQN